MNELESGLPDNYYSLSRLEALREAVGGEIAYWSATADRLDDETEAGQAALVIMDYWIDMRSGMWSDDEERLRAVEAALRAERARRLIPQEVA